MADMAARGSFTGVLAGGTTGVGSLPHRDAHAAAEFSMLEHDVMVVPSLPRRSPAESMIAQGVVGIPGVMVGQYGSIAVDVRRLDPAEPVATDVGSDGFVGFRTFLAHAAAAGADGRPVKWQLVGPVTLGLALVRAGAPVDIAFEVAAEAVRAHVRALAAEVATALPTSLQIIVLDEPSLVELLSPAFPLAPEPAVDLISTALAAAEPHGAVGVHCCGPTDVASVVAAGPDLMSLPAGKELVTAAGYVQEFLDQGGWIAWGAVATDGPIGVTAGRAWHHLSGVWCELVQRGVDPVLLRQQSLVTPVCGLGMHTPPVAGRICHLVRDVSRRVRDQATATRFVLGA
jgi:hypothetical protein